MMQPTSIVSDSVHAEPAEPLSAGAVVARLPSLTAALGAHVEAVERARTLTPEVLALLHDHGLFRLAQPTRFGGGGATLLTTMEVLEEIAATDGSMAWALMIGMETPHLLARLPGSEFERLVTAHPDGLLAGGFAPSGTAERVPGGYVVEGRWAFATGSPHATWLLGNCVVTEGRRPVLDGAGVPETRGVVLDREGVVLRDTWHALGLRGTGSGELEVRGQFVPHERTFDLFSAEPAAPDPRLGAPVAQFALHIGAVALGIARAALHDVTALAMAEKRPLYTGRSLASSERFAVQLGRAEAQRRAARAALHHEATALGKLLSDAPEAAAGQFPPLAATVHWVTRACVGVVDACFEAAGSSPVMDASPLQRRFRDIHTLAQHAGTSAVWAQRWGEARLGRGYGLTF